MDIQRLQEIGERSAGFSWTMAICFLALAHPAHAAIDSEPGALLLQAVGAGLVGILFATRKTLKRRLDRVAEFFASRADDRDSLSAVSVDGAEHARSS